VAVPDLLESSGPAACQVSVPDLEAICQQPLAGLEPSDLLRGISGRSRPVSGECTGAEYLVWHHWVSAARRLGRAFLDRYGAGHCDYVITGCTKLCRFATGSLRSFITDAPPVGKPDSGSADDGRLVARDAVSTARP